MFEQKIVMNKVAITISQAFGVSEERKAEILKKLIAVANIYPRYQVMCEVFLNCDDRFTEMERLYGLFLLGKTRGAVSILSQTRVKIRTKEFNMPLEMKLLSILSKDVIVEKVLMEALEQ